MFSNGNWFNLQRIRRAAFANRGDRSRGLRGAAALEPLESRTLFSTFTFRAAGSFAAGIKPIDVAAADYSGDGFPDLAVTNSGGAGGIVILLGRGNGQFTLARTLVGSFAATGIATADFNGDHIPDLVSVGLGSGLSAPTQVVVVQTGNGNGTFSPASLTPIGSEGGSSAVPLSLAVGDLNGDGNPDIVVVDAFGATASVLLGNGDGTFGTPQNYALGGLPGRPVLADFNDDGKLDIATASGSQINILLNRGNGSFDALVPIPASLSTNDDVPTPIAADDLNGDGFVDLVAPTKTVGGLTSSTSEALTVFLGRGDGTFAAQPVTGTAAGAGTLTSLGLSDMNGDGKLDVVASDSTSAVRIYPGQDNGAFTTPATFSTKNVPLTATVADVTRDGAPDILTVDSSAGSVSVLVNTTSTPTPTPVPSGTLDIATVRTHLPPAILTGAKLKGSATVVVASAGNAAFFGPAQVSLFLSTDTTASGTLLTTVQKTLTLAAGGGHRFTLPISSAALTVPGTYQVVASVTPAGSIASAAATSTVTVAPAFIDLAGAFTAVPGKLKPATKAVVSLAVTNLGNTLATGPLSVQLTATPATGGAAISLLVQPVSIHLKPGQKKKIGLKFTTDASLTAGKYTFTAVLDPANAFADTNLANNTITSG